MQVLKGLFFPDNKEVSKRRNKWMAGVEKSVQRAVV